MKGDERVIARLEQAGKNDVGVPQPALAEIASAHAPARGAVLVTANLNDMVRVPGLQVEDWTAAT